MRNKNLIKKHNLILFVNQIHAFRKAKIKRTNIDKKSHQSKLNILYCSTFLIKLNQSFGDKHDDQFTTNLVHPSPKLFPLVKSITLVLCECLTGELLQIQVFSSRMIKISYKNI